MKKVGKTTRPFSEKRVTQSHLALCYPMDTALHSAPGSSVHAISQARKVEGVAIPFSRVFSLPRDQIWIPAMLVDSLPAAPLGKPTLSKFWEEGREGVYAPNQIKAV